MRAIQITETGGPEVLTPIELPDPAPGPGELLVEVAAAGVTFIDTYQRAGSHPMSLPYLPGREGAGRVRAVGDGAAGFAAGERVAWSDAQGSYAELVVVPADKAVAVPDAVSDEVAVGALLQGMTAHTEVDDLAAEVRALTGGVGVAVAYDSVGRSTFDASLASLRRRGMLMLFGADIQGRRTTGKLLLPPP